MSLAAFFCSMVGRVSGRWGGGGGGGDSGRMRHNLLNILSRSINIITGSSHPVSRLINKLTWYFSQKNDFYGCHIGPLKFYTERNGRNLYFAIKLSGYGMPSEVFLRCCCCCSLRSLSVPWNLFFSRCEKTIFGCRNISFMIHASQPFKFSSSAALKTKLCARKLRGPTWSKGGEKRGRWSDKKRPRAAVRSLPDTCQNLTFHCRVRFRFALSLGPRGNNASDIFLSPFFSISREGTFYVRNAISH
jgi:hypothetical protein